MTNLEKIWLHLFRGGKLSDRGAMVKYAYGAFRSRVAEKREEYHILDNWDELKTEESTVRYKQYFIDPMFLRSQRGAEIRASFERKALVRKSA